MWLPVVLAVATLVLLQIPHREMFESVKDPSTLTSDEFKALIDTPEGQTLRTEAIAALRRRGIPDSGIPEMLPGWFKGILTNGWQLYSSLTDKTQLESRLHAQLVSEQSVRRNGQATADAAFNFAKMYFLRPEAAPAQASVEVTKAAGQPEAVALSPLSVLLQSVKDEEIRTMLKNYATHMVSYQTTGQSSYKTAADLSLDAIKKHVAELDAKAEADAERVTKFVDKYETDNQDINDLRKQLRSIRREGPQLQDQYETQKKINENVPVFQKHYLLKLGLIVGLIAIAYFASSSQGSGYALKAGLVIGLLSIGFAVYKFLLG